MGQVDNLRAGCLPAPGGPDRQSARRWTRLLFLTLLALTAHAATVAGSVRLVDSQEPKVRRKGDFSGVVVWLESAAAQPLEAKPRRVYVVQKDKRFTPHIVAIPVGSSIDFPNLDPFFHNAFSNFSGQPFDVGLYAPGTSRKVQFLREGVVRVFCNIHPTMSAVIVVAPTPYMAISAKTGQFSMDNVTPGAYKLRVFHERSSEPTLRALDRRITVEDIVQLGSILVSESGYIEVPHKNKFGQDYPPPIEDRAIYPPGKTP